jgi:alpha-glucosidase (family GH31 glycosyl hydrolase)
MDRSTWVKFGQAIPCVPRHVESIYPKLIFVDYQAFPDWFGENTQTWWTDALRNWTEMGVEFSGIWLDMNEPSSFCSYSWSVILILNLKI